MKKYILDFYLLLITDIYLLKNFPTFAGMNRKEKRILHLVRWYPNRYDSMYGLFVKNHYEATSLYCPSYLIYTHAVTELINNYEVVVSEGSNKLEVIVYYRDFDKKLLFFTPFIKGYRFIAAHRKGLKELKKRNLNFNFVHIHVLTRLGLFGLYFKYFKGINFGVTEHWSRYLPHTGNYGGFLRKILTKKIIKKASFVSTVTENLHQAMINHGLLNDNYFVLPNVVTPDFYGIAPEPKASNPMTFVHVSSFEDKSKNISGIIRVIEELSLEREDFVFKIIGDGMDFKSLQSYAEAKVSNSSCIEFTGLLQGKALVEELSRADAMVVFSNYENFPVVINEALVLGLPVIATSVGGIPEILDEDCGVLIPKGDELALKQALLKFLNDEFNFDSNKIRNRFQKLFSLESVGKFLCEKY